jgi:hypothetical protein
MVRGFWQGVGGVLSATPNGESYIVSMPCEVLAVLAVLADKGRQRYRVIISKDGKAKPHTHTAKTAKTQIHTDNGIYTIDIAYLFTGKFWHSSLAKTPPKPAKTPCPSQNRIRIGVSA